MQSPSLNPYTQKYTDNVNMESDLSVSLEDFSLEVENYFYHFGICWLLFFKTLQCYCPAQRRQREKQQQWLRELQNEWREGAALVQTKD